MFAHIKYVLRRANNSWVLAHGSWVLVLVWSVFRFVSFSLVL